MKITTGLITIAICLTLTKATTRADWSVDVESGVAYNGYNDVRIPGNTGSEISLSDDLKSDGTGFIRVRATVDLSERSRLSALAAPLRIESSGSVNRPVDYNGVRFPAGEYLNARYRFDSYRLSYTYAFVKSERLRFDLGLTAKIRDAAIKIESDQRSSEKTNTGFVPLIRFGLDWSFAANYGLLFQGDALAAPQGRAEDVLLALYTDPADWMRFRVGYRILEGGADNDEVYNFALVHYLGAGVTLTF